MNKTKTKINTKVTSKTQGSENLPYYGYIKLYYLKQTALPSVNQKAVSYTHLTLPTIRSV